jgi:hypothetical protein
MQHKIKTQEKSRERNEKQNLNNLHILGPKRRKITNLFKHSNVEISFKNTNTVQQLTKPRNDKFLEEDKGGIYELTCNTYHMSYIGWRTRSLRQRYQEHTRYIKHNEPHQHIHCAS